MTKARDLANLIAAGNPLADGAISVAEISDLTASAAELNKMDGLTASTAELNNVVGTTSALQTQLDNISVTSGSLTKSFANGETASITLAQAISPAPVVSATKEVAQAGISSKGAWDVNASASNYDLHNTAYDTTLTPSTVLDLTSATYDNNSRSTGGSYGPRFSSDGLKLFVNDQGANNIRQYNLSTAWLLPSSATHTTFSTASQVSDESGFCFSDNGLHFYLCDSIYGSSSNSLHQYSITSGYPYDLVGYGSFTRTINMTALGEATPQVRPISSVLVEDNGTKMYIFSSSGSSALIRQYTLSTAYDPSSATYDNKSFDIYADYGSGGYLGNSSLSSDGKQLLVANGADDIVMHYTLGTAWDISTASRIGIYNPAEDANVSGVHLKPDNSKFFMLGGSNQTFYRYTLGSSNSLALGTGSFASTDVGKRIQGNGGDVTLTSTAGAYDTTGGSAFTDSSTIASGSWTMRGLKSAGDADGIGLSGISTINPINFATASYDNKSVYTGTQATSEDGVFFKPDGTRMYVLATGGGTHKIWQYDLSTAWDVSTASYNNVSKAISTYTNNAGGIFFKPDGLQMFIVDRANTQIDVYTLSTAWDLSTLTYSTNQGVSNFAAQPFGIFFKPDGTKMYICDANTDSVRERTLTTAWDVSTNGSGQSFSFASQETEPHDVEFTSDGLKMYIVGRNSDKVYEYDLSTAWDVTSASYNNVFLDVSPQGFQPNGLHLKADDQSKLYVVFSDSVNSVMQYSTGASTSYNLPTSQYNIAVTNSGGQIDTGFWNDINSMTADQAAGDGTVHYAVSTDDRTTWSVAKASDGVRPIVRDNSGTWQYNSQESTATVSHDLANATNRQTFSVAGQTGEPLGIDFFDSGNKFIIVDNSNDRIFEYSCSTAYDITTASYNNKAYHFGSTISGDPPFVVFNGDGTKLYVGSQGNQRIHTFSMSTAYDISTITGNTFTTTLSSMFPIGGMRFNNDGTKLYATKASGSGNVEQFSLSTAYDVSTANSDSVTFTPTGNNFSSSPGLEGLHFTSDGTKLYLAADNIDTIYYATLTIAWDLSTASEQAFYYEGTVGSASDYAIQDVYVIPNGTKLITINKTNDALDVYDIGSITVNYSTSTTWTNATTNDEFYALQEALGATSSNRMDKTQLDAVADGSHFTLGDTLDLAIALRMDTASSSTPKSDGVSINYDAQALNQGAVLGTDYDYDFPDSTTVRVTSNAAQNLKVRVV